MSHHSLTDDRWIADVKKNVSLHFDSRSDGKGVQSNASKSPDVLIASYISRVTMHELFDVVLSRRDLSKAGDLFSLDDRDIEADLSAVLSRIQEIIGSPTYLTSNNDQSVVEICINRVTAAIR